MKVFVTGGTGYIGTRLVRALIDGGHEVVCLSRTAERGVPLAEMGAGVVPGDVTRFDEARLDLAGFDAVVHSAAMVKIKAKNPRDFDRVNVDGLAKVAAAALDAGVGRFVYTSSFMALGAAGEDAAPLDETVRRDGGHVHNDYERTKYLGHVEFERWLERGLPGIALFPCVVYGPGAMTNGNITASTIADFLLGRLPGLLGDGSRVWTYSYAGDVVAGHVAALERGRVGEGYILGGESATMGEFVRMVADVAGVAPPKLHIPYALAKVAAFAEEVKASMAKREPKLTREVVEVYKHHWVYSSDKAIAELGYSITPLAEGLAETVKWVQSEIAEGRIK
jgi:farnesol dehydrogenase